MSDKLRVAVRSWYGEEAARVADAFEESGDLGKVDFDELVRRSQVLLACELVQLIADEQDVRLAPGSPDYHQLQRVAQAMRARGDQVPESISKALGEE